MVRGGCTSRRAGTSHLAIAICVVATIASGCSTDAAPQLGDDLLTPADLGPGFEGVSFEARMSATCTLSIESDPTDREGTTAVSNARQERVSQELLSYADATAAAEAFESARASSSCETQGNLDPAPAPTDVSVKGVDEAFSFGFTDANDSVGVVVTRVERTLSIFTIELHQGASTEEPIGALDVAALGAERLSQ